MAGLLACGSQHRPEPSRTAVQWSHSGPLAAHSCGGSRGLGENPAPRSLFSPLPLGKPGTIAGEDGTNDLPCPSAAFRTGRAAAELAQGNARRSNAGKSILHQAVGWQVAAGDAAVRRAAATLRQLPWPRRGNFLFPRPCALPTRPHSTACAPSSSAPFAHLRDAGGSRSRWPMAPFATPSSGWRSCR